jgi:hypothetical protein
VAGTGPESYPIASYYVSSDESSGCAVTVLVWDTKFRSTQFPVNNRKSNSLLSHHLAEGKTFSEKNQHMAHFRAVPHDVTSDSMHITPPTMVNRSLRRDAAVTPLTA